MVLILHNHEIRGLMDISETIAAVDAGYREYGKATAPPSRARISGSKGKQAILMAVICPGAAKLPSNSKRDCCPA